MDAPEGDGKRTVDEIDDGERTADKINIEARRPEDMITEGEVAKLDRR